MRLVDCPCGQKMAFGIEEETGKKIPIDPKAAVYRLIREDEEGRPIVRRDRSCAVNHYATCTKRDHFTGKTKRL